MSLQRVLCCWMETFDVEQGVVVYHQFCFQFSSICCCGK